MKWTRSEVKGETKDKDVIKKQQTKSNKENRTFFLNQVHPHQNLMHFVWSPS
jgi:hypothetical protein